MADSTPTENLERQNRQAEALDNTITTVDGCELFGKALTEYHVASALIHATNNDDISVLRPAAGIIDRAAWNVVVAAADYHCACVVFGVVQALDAINREEA